MVIRDAKFPAISNIYALVIIVTLTISIGIAATLWIMGVLSTRIGDIEYLYIFPNTSLAYNGTAWILKIYVENRGSKDAEIMGIRVSNIPCQIEVVKLEPGDRKPIECSLDGPTTIASGIEYDVKIYTKRGNIFATRARSAIE
jgi:hypothetical protein